MTRTYETVDADGHILEPLSLWDDYIDPAFRERRPQFVIDDNGKERLTVEGKLLGNPRGIGSLGSIGVRQGDVKVDTLKYAEGRKGGFDPHARIVDMDADGIDAAFLYPSLGLFTGAVEAPDLSAAMCRAYNRWLADIHGKARGRLRWIVLAPVRSIDRAIEEINLGKLNGACGVFMHGFEGERLLSDSTLFPLYEAASKLDMPICIHAGTGNFAHYDLFGQDVFSRFKLPAVGAFNNLVYQAVPDRFPDLRWCFVETSSQWVPYVINDLTIRTQSELAFRRNYSASGLASVRGKPRELAGRNLLKENRIYVACQTTDDLAYVLQYAGEDNIIVGTDYGHADYSNDIEAVGKLGENGEIGPTAAGKILGENPKRLYAL